MPGAILLVRAELNDPQDREAFDRWYENDHLPAALAAFRAERAWRCWSTGSAPVHYAFYAFADLRAAQAIMGSAELATLVADFDRSWGSRTVRRRDILDIVQERSGS